jgi:tetratricopeptide (TPR) repeat protein
MVALRETAKDEGEILAALDRLSKALRERIGESLKSLQNTERLERATTGSLAALKKYSEGVRLDDAGDYRAAYIALREAVAADSTFAMAWRKLGVVTPRAGVADSIGDAATTRAYLLRDRLPPLEQELASASYHFSVDPIADSAIAALRRAQAIDPRDRTSGTNLPYLLNLLGRFTEAEPLAREQLARDPSYFAFERLTVSLQGQGRFADAESVATEFARRNPSHPAGAWFLADNAFAAGDYARSDSLARLPITNQAGSPARINALGLRARAAIVQGRLALADRLLDSLAAGAVSLGDTSTVIGTYRRKLAADHRLRPTPRLSTAGFDSILRLPGVSPAAGLGNSLYLAAMTAGESGDTAAARRLFEEADRNLDATGRRRVAGRALAASVLAREAGRFDEALALMNQAYPGLSDPCTRCGDHMRAEIWDAAGNPDSALVAYERALTRPTPGSLAYEESRIPSAYRRLGELYEQKGDRAKAIDWYQKFVDLWRDADPELQPVVAEVKQRLAQLSGEPKR